MVRREADFAGQPLADAAKAFLAMGCFGAMAYFAFAAFTRDQASHSALCCKRLNSSSRRASSVEPTVAALCRRVERRDHSKRRLLQRISISRHESEAPSGSAPQLLPESAPTSPSTPDQPSQKTEKLQLAPQSKDSHIFDEFGKPTPKLVQAEAGIACPPRDTFENAQAWVHERFKCERHPTPIEPWIEWAEYCPSGPLGYFVLKVKTGQQKVYLFENIPPAVWEGFKAAPSAGKFYHSKIKGKRHWFRLASQLKPSTCSVD
jgi:KTSC domain